MCRQIHLGRNVSTRPSWVIVILLVSVFSSIMFCAPVFAQEDADCFVCHGDPNLTATDAAGETSSLYVDEEAYVHTIHGPMGCVACHSDIAELPHPADLAAVDCGTCHSETEEYKTSLHGIAVQNGDADVSGCTDCHGKHDMRPSDDPLSRTHPLNLPETCGQCHSDPELVHRHMVTVSSPSSSYLKSFHAQAIRAGNMEAAVCNDCHGTHDMLPAHLPDSPVFRLNIPATCGQCHPKELEEYNQSIHGQALAAGIPDTPTCVDCHGEHDIEAPDSDTSPVSRQQITRSTCPSCHDDEKVMEQYGVVTMRSASYMDSYHGMASAAGSTVVADCTSCHGVHNILPHGDPASTTHKDNLPQTCGQCHEGAGPNFAAGPVHIMPTDPGQRALGIVRIAYIWLLVLILGGMVLHNTILMLRHMFSKFGQEMSGKGTHKRFNKGQTIGHLILTIAFIVLAVTGFALRYPDTWWSKLIFLGTGFELRSIIHRYAGLVLIGITIVNMVYVIATRGGRKELRSLILSWKDIKDFFGNMRYAFGLSKSQPRYDRYTYSEKFEYWGLWWGSVLMAVTGLCMWYANWFLDRFPKIALDIMALIHFYEAWLAVGTIVIWHFYFMILDPETYPMNWSWITGNITEEDFKERHPVEYEREVGPIEHGKSTEQA